MLRPILTALRGPRTLPPALLDVLGRAPLAAPAPPLAGASPLAAIEAIEAAEFAGPAEGDLAATSDRFGLLAGSIDAAVERGRRDLAAIEAIEAVPRPHGRGHGLEWAYEQQFVDADRLRQVAALLRALAPHEAAVRALLTDTDPRQ